MITPKVKLLLQQLTSAIDATGTVETAHAAAAPGPGVTPPPPAPPANWWNPSPEETASFCADNGLDPRQITPWTQSPDGETHKATEGTSLESFPLLKALDPSDIKTAMRYAAFGYGPDGARRLSTEIGFKQARTMADRIAASDNPGEFLPGSEYGNNDSDAYALMVGFGKLDSQSPMLGGGVSVGAIIKTVYAQSGRKPGEPGASGL